MKYGAERDRTVDLVSAIHALFQLSYGPNLKTAPCLIDIRGEETGGVNPVPITQLKLQMKKSTTKKTAAKVAATAKKSPSKKASNSSKSAVESDAAAYRLGGTTTTIIVKTDVGFGNELHLRGEGPGLSWDQGVRMENIAPDEWIISTKGIDRPLICKVLINDEIWSAGENYVVRSGEKSVIIPTF